VIEFKAVIIECVNPKTMLTMAITHVRNVTSKLACVSLVLKPTIPHEMSNHRI
jgi:hypothetical protein